MSKRTKLAVAGAVLLGGAAWLAFGFFGVHTLFIDEKVDEAAPVFAGGDSGGMAAMPGDAEGDPGPDATSETTETTEPQVTVVAEGAFVDRSHPTSGVARVLSGGGAERVLRLEDFRTDNGPDLNVYLSAAPPDAPAGQFDDDYVDLGDLKGNIGNQNYDIPEDVDLDHYSTVVIWCVRFDVAFGAAALA